MPEMRKPASFLSRHGAQSGGLWGFLVIKITAACCICHCIILQSEREDKTRKMPHGAQRMYLVFCLLLRVVCKNPKTPNWVHNWRHSSNAWGWYRRCGISGIDLWVNQITAINNPAKYSRESNIFCKMAFIYIYADPLPLFQLTHHPKTP